jgi:hypothetical protein
MSGKGAAIMKMRIASTLVSLMSAAAMLGAPALAEPEVKTQLVALDGKSVDVIQLRHDFNSVWVIDNRNVLYRDDSRDYYVVTLKEACEPLEIRDRRFSFYPEANWRLKASNTYEIHPLAGRRCSVGKIEQISDERAKPMRAAALWRMW